MEPTGRWKLGFVLALTTALLWGVLPIALKILLASMDAYSITWYRFATASIILGAYLVWKRSIPDIRGINASGFLLLFIAAIGLCGNYVIYLFGLEYVSPETAQMVIQLAPFFLLLGGIIFFKEEFRKQQWIGLVLLVAGLVMYFNNRFADLLESNGRYRIGVLIIVLAALFWASYALAQKKLLTRLASEQILWLIYVASVILLLPLSRPGSIKSLDTLGWIILIFCCLNTLVAYGAFAEALVHWQASRVSAVITITPLITLCFIWALNRLIPGFVIPERLDSIAIIGAFLVVTGSMLTALGSRKRKIQEAQQLATLD